MSNYLSRSRNNHLYFQQRKKAKIIHRVILDMNMK